MKRTTLFVSEMLERELQLYARREGRPVAWVVREALTEYIVSRRAVGRVPSFTGQFDSGRADIAETHEHFLFDGLSPHDQPREVSPSIVKARTRRPSKPRKR